MTYKQMIIDDQKETIHRLQQECTEKTNAIIALGEHLKAKGQECEKAKQNAQDTYDLWQALIESFNILQAEKIKLEQECEKLKKELMQYEKDVKDLNYFAIKLKQTLAEIKDIAKNGCYDDFGMPLDELSIILQKISEYEVEDD